MITIFTPTYNRAYSLPDLYNSLCKQTCKDFEWVVVDDGSIDGTEELIAEFLDNQAKAVVPFCIKYFKQENGGKHRAINRGVREAEGELFFIVDSDDQLTHDAVEWIEFQWSRIVNENVALNRKFVGLSGIRVYPDGKKIGGEKYFDQIDATALDIRWKYKIKGDLAEVYRTDILRQFPFPDIAGETFCTESLIWDRIAAQGYILRYIHQGIYIGNYLADGLSAKQHRIRKENPNYSMLYDAEGSRLSGASWRYRIKRAIKFWEFSFESDKKFIEKARMVGFPGVLFLPLGWLMKMKK